MTWIKTDIINHLAEVRGYRRYLEICTPLTGNEFARIDRPRFDICHRLMYRCPEDFTDDMPIEFRAAELDISGCLQDSRLQGAEYDIILVDSWHEYEPSYRDLKAALGLLNDKGSIVVHDCLPPTDDIISPTWTPGSWCGVSFVAFLDFVQSIPGLEYVTVDTDYGCGIVRKSPARIRHLSDGEMKLRWDSVRHDPRAAYRFMIENKAPLLNLLSVEEFKQLNGAG